MSHQSSWSLTPFERQQNWWILRHYSVTYSNATRFFPPYMRDKVGTIYAWVRLADEAVDNPTQQSPQRALQRFRHQFKQTWQHPTRRTKYSPIHAPFVRLAQQEGIEQAWCEAFLHSMELDLTKRSYTRAQLNTYIYGSAEVIGLMMTRIMSVQHYDAEARALGEWMQRVNFVRDIGEDATLRSRVYMPTELLAEHGLNTADIRQDIDPKIFTTLVRQEIESLEPVFELAWSGIQSLPWQYRWPIELATRLYLWSLCRIYDDPMIVWHKQLKPSKRIIAWALSQMALGRIRQIGTPRSCRLQTHPA